MTKRVAWFTGQASSGAVTPHKVYDVFNEDDNSFNLKDNTGDTRFCLKKGCAHACHRDWVFADIVEEVKEAVTEVVEQTKPEKVKKWSKWIKNTTGKCPEGLKRKQKIKLKWSDGDKFNISKPHDAAWYIDKGGVNITHYKVKLKDVSEDTHKAREKPKSKWTKNTGVMPVGGDIEVEFKRRDGDKYKDEAGECDWQLQGQDYDIIRWRLAD